MKIETYGSETRLIPSIIPANRKIHRIGVSLYPCHFNNERIENSCIQLNIFEDSEKGEGRCILLAKKDAINLIKILEDHVKNIPDL